MSELKFILYIQPSRKRTHDMHIRSQHEDMDGGEIAWNGSFDCGEADAAVAAPMTTWMRIQPAGQMPSRSSRTETT